MPDLNWTQIKFLFQKHGWVQKRQEGSHSVWEKNGRTERVAVGFGHSMGGGGLKEVLKRFGIDMNEIAPVEAKRIERAKYRLPQSTDKKPIFLPPEGTMGREIFDWRRANNVSADGLGKLVGVSGALVGLWERSKSKIQPKQLEKLAELHVIKSATQSLVVTGDRTVDSDLGLAKGRNGIKPHIPSDDGPGKGRLKPLPIVEDRKVIEQELPRPSLDEKALARSLQAEDLYYWALEQENKVRKLELELAKYENENLVEIRDKARKYDDMKKLFT
jgi:transcriptional regulator with XRE-family HTH domain/predicted RNA binding protein YcfA (HicA-like mRNA interferase family)